MTVEIFSYKQFWDIWGLLWTRGLFLSLTTMAVSALAALIVYRQKHQPAPRSIRSLLRFYFPAEFLQHASCRTDLVYVAVRAAIPPLGHAANLIGTLSVAAGVYGNLAAIFGPRSQHQLALAPWLLVVALCVILQDALSFHVHYIQHKLRLLWEVHKVHHSIEFLMPVLSGRRIHPLEEAFDGLVPSVGVGLLLGVISYDFNLSLQTNLIAGADAYIAINLLSFSHLRHSHIPLRYGWLERVLLSPAQHHIHHSCEPHLWDKNFGWLFSAWDQLYGTIVYSAEAPSFRIGLPPDSRDDYDRVWKLYFMPFRNIYRMAWTRTEASAPGGIERKATNGSKGIAAGATGRSGGVFANQGARLNVTL